jgi:DNA-binding CsgD family transcriptional regulator
MDVSLSDISKVLRLVREVCDRWDDPQAWREHLLHGACALLNGNVGMMLTEHDGKSYHFGRLSVTSVVGLTPPMRMLVQPAILQMQNRDYQDVSDNLLPGLTRLYDDLVRQGWVTVPRSQMTDEETYHAAPHYLSFRKQLDCDDYVVSIRMVDLPRRPEAINIDRPHGAEPFGPREVAILRLLHDEVGPLVGVRLATEEHLCRDGLSKRLRETLSLLLEGLGEKQVAGALDLSIKTVHEYVGMLYEHFHVSSRGELLAYFIRREPVLRRRVESKSDHLT